MNNLKRVLSLGLSGVMLAGLLTVGASAADFTDAEDIQHADAVNTLVALKVIDGKDDGSFAPEETVTRSQMAKMIAVAMNGGSETTTGTKTNPSFTDIKGHWAESYIEFCSDLDIISGRGDGTFDPEAKVTGLEAAKMVLTALGYNADAYLLKGEKWATRTDELARAADPSLYDELAGVTMNAPINRDVAAQMIWNGLQNWTKRITPNENKNNGEITWTYGSGSGTLLYERFNATVGYGYMTDVAYDEDTEVFTYSLSNSAEFGAEPLTAEYYNATTGVYNANDRGVSGDFDTKDDVSDLFGQKVKVVFKNDKYNTVFGIFAAGDQVVATTAIGKSLNKIKDADNSVKASGVTCRFGAKVPTGTSPTTYPVSNRADAVPTYIYRANTTYASAVKLHNLYLSDKSNAIYTAKLIDNDDDGRVNCVVVTPLKVGKVTFVGKTSVTAGNAAYKYEDCDIYEGVEKNDWAIITEAAYTGKDVDTLVEADIVNGVIEATRSVGVEAKIADVWYEDIPTGKAGDDYVVDEEFDLYVVNGYVISAKSLEEGVDYSNAVYVTQADEPGEDGTTTGGTQRLKLLFADDSSKIVTVDEIDNKDVKYSGTWNTDKSNAATGTNVYAIVGQVYTYSVDKSGNYSLTSINANDFDNKKATTAAAGGLVIKDGRIKADNNFMDGTSPATARTYRFADNGVVFVKYTHNTTVKYAALSGTKVAKWDKTTSSSAAAGANYVYANQGDDGFFNVELGVIDLVGDDLPGASGDTVYAWITAKPEVVKQDGDWYVKVYVWDGEKDTFFLTDGESSKFETDSNKNKAQYQKGQPISYKAADSDNVVDKDTVTQLGSPNAVTGYNVTANYKGIDIRDASNSKQTGEITNDTVIIYVNMADNEGVEGGEIQIAQTDSDGKYINNCYVGIESGSSSDDVLYIFVDTNNDIGTEYNLASATGVTVSGITYNAAPVTGLTKAAAGDTVTYNVTSAAGASGKTVKVKFGTNQEKIVTLDSTGAGTVEFVMTAQNTPTVTVCPEVTFTAPAAVGSSVAGLTAGTPSTSATKVYAGDSVTVTVGLTGTATATGTLTCAVTGGSGTVTAKSSTAATGYTASGAGFAVANGATNTTLTWTVVIDAATTAVTLSF